MLPAKKEKKARTSIKKEPIDWSLPGHDFLGPGTDLEKKNYYVPRSKLDQAAKIHDFHYANKYISTESADKLFYEKKEGFAARSRCGT